MSSASLSLDWVFQLKDSPPELCLIKLHRQSAGPVIVSVSVVISSNLTWTAHVHGQPLTCGSQIPPVLSLASFMPLVDLVTTSRICAGHSDSTFIEMARTRGGKLLSQTNEVVAYLDEHWEPCIRHKNCELLVRRYMHRASISIVSIL